MFHPKPLLFCIALSLAIGLAVCGGMSGTPPTITTQPQDQTIGAGAMATFSVTASGSSPLMYQWMRNGMAISGATSATYTTPPTTLADDNSQFAVVVSNNSSSVTSNSATLHVLAVP
jgi:hypothetical protein